MFKEGEDYKTIKPEDSYLVLRDYSHTWIGNGPNLNRFVVASKDLEKFVTFNNRGLVLHEQYEWNGSNLVVDSPMCMRASAVHDAWCQGMRLGILENTEKNWGRGVDEYIAICRADGLNFLKRRLREIFMKLWGEFKFPS